MGVRRLLWLLASTLLAPHAALAATLVVPDSYATIQAALNAAAPGDTVSVKDTAGPYHEKIGATLTLRGKGSHLPLPTLGFTAPVTLQLENDAGSCWGATFSSFTKNEAQQFKGKGRLRPSFFG
jgi:hypothetical protein